MTLEEALVTVWRAALIDRASVVELGDQFFPVRTTQKKRLRQVDFIFNNQELRGLEQNPETGSRWAQLARSGHRVMQFLSAGRYLANVVDGKVTLYRGKRSDADSPVSEPSRMKRK